MEIFKIVLSILILIAMAVFTAVSVSTRREQKLAESQERKTVSNLDTTYAGMDLSGKPRATYRLVLPDGEVLYLRTPTKAVADCFERIGKILQHISYGNCSDVEKNELHLYTSVILSHNTGGKKIDAEKVMEMLTLADLTELLTDYMQWLTEVIESKN